MHFRTYPLQMGKKQPAFRRAGQSVKSVFFFDRFQGAHPDGCAPVPGTKVCTVRSGERFAEAVQHRSKLGARGCGLRREGIAADAED